MRCSTRARPHRCASENRGRAEGYQPPDGAYDAIPSRTITSRRRGGPGGDEKTLERSRWRSRSAARRNWRRRCLRRPPLAARLPSQARGGMRRAVHCAGPCGDFRGVTLESICPGVRERSRLVSVGALTHWLRRRPELGCCNAGTPVHHLATVDSTMRGRDGGARRAAGRW
jgi:hypothetical protein